MFYSDLLVLLSDFNHARSGMQDSSSRDPWGLARGPHGHGSVNDAGKELLTFSMPIMQVCVTPGFRKRTSTLLLGNIQSQSDGIVLASSPCRLFCIGGEKKSLVYTVCACAKYSTIIHTDMTCVMQNTNNYCHNVINTRCG